MTILLKSMLELSITYHEKGSYLPRARVITEIMMNDIITKIETFLAYSDEKLAELEKENQRLKEDNQYTETD